MAVIIELEWGVSPNIPSDWHSQENIEGFEITISDSLIIAKHDNDCSPDLQDTVERLVTGILTHIGLKEATVFTPKFHSRVEHEQETGRRSITVQLEPMVAKLRVTADVSVFDGEGKLIVDSRRERFSQLANSVSDSANETLHRMSRYLLLYYGDTEKRFAPIYDIWELANTVFGNSESRAAKALGFSSGEWTRIRQTTNNSTVTNARHPGQTTSSQREATDVEISFCVSAAHRIIEKYRELVRNGTAPR